MDDFLGKAVPSPIEDGQGRKHGPPQSSPSGIFNRIKLAAPPGRRAALQRYGSPAALTACLIGLAWLGWSHTQGRAPTPPSAETDLPVQKTAEESRALRAEAMPAAVNMEEGNAPEKAKPAPEAAKNEGRPGIVQAASKTNRLPHKPVEELAKRGERVDLIGLKIAALPAVDPVVVHSVSATPVARKRGQRARHDAFDPSQHPNAPGAPRPLGTIRSTAPANKGSAEYPSGQPAN